MQLAAFACIVSCMYTVVSAQLVPYGAAFRINGFPGQLRRIGGRTFVGSAQLSPGSSVGHWLGRDDLINHVQALQ